ncbi:MAG: hypothetical protein IJ733_14100 [Lachnospiraceae bacterium]|nr:hypothetical protein [Lachnospiraceae bacterium]
MDLKSCVLYNFGYDSSFSDLYNEVNVFCALMNNNVVSSEKVLQNTGINLLIKLADDQCDIYERLKKTAEKFGYKNEFKRPDWDAFQEYDEFLQSRMSDNQWKRLVEKRKKVELKL